MDKGFWYVPERIIQVSSRTDVSVVVPVDDGFDVISQRGSRFYFRPKPPLDDDQAAAALFPFSFARPSSMTSISFSSCLIEELRLSRG
jgi:hypothetical protein